MATKILVVEDDPEFLHLIQVILEQAGYLPALATSATTALRWLEDPASRPDIVLLDIGLPDKNMDGLDLCRALKRNPATHRLPIVILTAHAENAMRVKAALSSADLVLSKPIKADELLNALDAMMKVQRAERRGVLHRAGLELDPAKSTVFWNGNTVRDLGPRLFDVLYLLVEHSPHPITCRRIMSSLRLETRDSEVYVLVSRLRARMRREFGVDFVQTVPNKGYRLEVPVPEPTRPP
ncbi:MAG: response regulator transcription factor [Elusimicrobia bacterium]|nr:response regulator transcription factor [Elusimicrobiota bacterium]